MVLNVGHKSTLRQSQEYVHRQLCNLVSVELTGSKVLAKLIFIDLCETVVFHEGGEAP